MQPVRLEDKPVIREAREAREWRGDMDEADLAAAYYAMAGAGWDTIDLRDLDDPR